VYALEAHGPCEGDTLPATLGDMFADYMDQFQCIQAAGPYYLLGWSFGAVAANAIATEMQARGLEVGGLVLIDGFSFDGAPWIEQMVPNHRNHWKYGMLSFREIRDASNQWKAILLQSTQVKTPWAIEGQVSTLFRREFARFEGSERYTGRLNLGGLIVLDRLCAIKRNNVQLQAYEDRSVLRGDVLLVNCGSHRFSWADCASGTRLEVIIPL